ncbi:unnamed protein product [Peronospora belbahrii]|uniref:PH domain-containing protein n=1 Tax=Peronospora belbahrii TaxID=622444 RepID=A0ABN8CRV5_9STRA|nr:unnamed protein product [Peronospora belbahrii]
MEQENVSDDTSVTHETSPYVIPVPIETIQDTDVIPAEIARKSEQYQEKERSIENEDKITTVVREEEEEEGAGDEDEDVGRDVVEKQRDVDESDDVKDIEKPLTIEEEDVTEATEENEIEVLEESETNAVQDVGNVLADVNHEDVVAIDDDDHDDDGKSDAIKEDKSDKDVMVNDLQDACQDVEVLDEMLINVTLETVANVDQESTYMEVSKPTWSIDSDDVAKNQATVTINGLVADETVATLDDTMQFGEEMELASPAAMLDLHAIESDMTTDDTDDPVSLEADAKELEGQDANEEQNEQGDHATITAVAESTDNSVPVDANLEVVLEEIRTKLPCESVEVLASGEILVLPAGWSTRQSKSNDGKTYYVSPYGYTQWLRPPIKTGVIYNWVHEIEVTFGPGRLGLNLKQIAGIPGTVFTDLQVHIAEIYKLPNGMASPAEIYNWSVKPEKRLAVNMRITMMNGISMAGYTYSEVLELLARLVRPVRLKFADVTKGIVGRVEEVVPLEDSEEVKEARAARVMQNSLRMEYFQILVSSELHKQVWAAMRHHIHLRYLETKKKCEVLETQVEREQRRQESLEKEYENLIREEASLKDMIKKLDMQVAGEIESPEVLRTAELIQRTVELDKDVTEIIAENDELQATRVKTEETLDCLQKELDEYGDLDIDLNGQQDIKFFSPAFLGSLVHRGSIDTRAEDAHERLLVKIKAQHDHFVGEIKMEEERAKFVQSEIQQFQDQMDVAAAAVKREDAFISGERPPQLIFLENKIALLQKNLRDTVWGIANATSKGDQQQAENLSRRRADLKDDLKAALDEMRRMEIELQVFFDVDEGKMVALEHADTSIDTVDIDEAPHERASESARLQNKLVKLQAQLHDTVVELAKAASEKDEARKSELARRRLQLKDEMKVVQDQFQELTNGTLNVSAKARESYLRPSVVGPPSIDDVSRRSIVSSRPSFGGIRNSIIGNRVSIIGGGNRGSVSVQQGPERFDPSRSRRSSSSASGVSVAQSHDSTLNQVVRDGCLPTMSGILRKHATHSNEKGPFGNMSLRGVRERWCNIEPDGFLRYYKREGDREPRGSIPLKNKSLEILYGKEVGKPNEFMICSPTQQTRMIAKTHDEMLQWVTMLESAHAYFMQQLSEHDQARGSLSPSVDDSNTDPEAADAELAYRNKRATLGF